VVSMRPAPSFSPCTVCRAPVLRGHRRFAPEAVAEGAHLRSGSQVVGGDVANSVAHGCSVWRASRNDSRRAPALPDRNLQLRCVRRPVPPDFVEMPDLLLDPLALRRMFDGPDQQIVVLPDRVVVY